MGFICDRCSTSETLMEFPTGRLLNEHVKSGHKTKPEGFKPRPKRITLEQAQKGTNLPPTTPEAVSATTNEAKQEHKVDAKPLPIELIYKYVGQCPTCLGELDTITVNMGAKDSFIAYCVNCKKQLKETKAIPIEKQK